MLPNWTMKGEDTSSGRNSLMRCRRHQATLWTRAHALHGSFQPHLESLRHQQSLQQVLEQEWAQVEPCSTPWQALGYLSSMVPHPFGKVPSTGILVPKEEESSSATVGSLDCLRAGAGQRSTGPCFGVWVTLAGRSKLWIRVRETSLDLGTAVLGSPRDDSQVTCPGAEPLPGLQRRLQGVSAGSNHPWPFSH